MNDRENYDANEKTAKAGVVIRNTPLVGDAEELARYWDLHARYEVVRAERDSLTAEFARLREALKEIAEFHSDESQHHTSAAGRFRQAQKLARQSLNTEAEVASSPEKETARTGIKYGQQHQHGG